MAQESLWPEDLFKKKLMAPVKILKEQGQALSLLSGGEILGDVVSKIQQHRAYEGPPKEVLAHHFILEVPDLGGYRFELLEATHEPRSLYPVDISVAHSETYATAKDGQELRIILEDIFKDERTVAILRTLKAQTEDPDARPPEEPPRTQEQSRGGDYGPPRDDDIPF